MRRAKVVEGEQLDEKELTRTRSVTTGTSDDSFHQRRPGIADTDRVGAKRSRRNPIREVGGQAPSDSRTPLKVIKKPKTTNNIDIQTDLLVTGSWSLLQRHASERHWHASTSEYWPCDLYKPPFSAGTTPVMLTLSKGGVHSIDRSMAVPAAFADPEPGPSSGTPSLHANDPSQSIPLPLDAGSMAAPGAFNQAAALIGASSESAAFASVPTDSADVHVFTIDSWGPLLSTTSIDEDDSVA